MLPVISFRDLSLRPGNPMVQVTRLQCLTVHRTRDLDRLRELTGDCHLLGGDSWAWQPQGNMIYHRPERTRGKTEFLGPGKVGSRG